MEQLYRVQARNRKTGLTDILIDNLTNKKAREFMKSSRWKKTHVWFRVAKQESKSHVPTKEYKERIKQAYGTVV